jgi:hypothetical protein
MYRVRICENNLQTDLCCLDYRAVQWVGRDGPRGFGAVEDRYLSICSNMSVIPSKEFNVYNYDLSK